LLRGGDSDERQPVAAGLVIFLSDDLDDVAGAQLGPERHHAAVDLGADACVAHLSVNGVGESMGVASAGTTTTLPLGVKV